MGLTTAAFLPPVQPVSAFLLLEYYFVFAFFHFAFKLTYKVVKYYYVTEKHRQGGLQCPAKTPGPEGSGSLSTPGFILGDAMNVVRHHLGRILHYRWESFKLVGFPAVKTYLVPVGALQRNYLIRTADPAVVKCILKEDFQKWDKWDQRPGKPMIPAAVFKEWLGNGIFVTRHSDENWSRWFMQRKTAANIFTRGAFRGLMLNTFVKKGQVLVDEVSKACSSSSSPSSSSSSASSISSSSSASSGEVGIDIQNKFFAFTMDSIMSIFFGRETNTVGMDSDPYADAFDLTHRSWWSYCFRNIHIFLFMSVLPFPFGVFFPWDSAANSFSERCFRFFSSARQDFDRGNATLRRESDAIIHARMNDPNVSQRRDMLSLFINANSPSGEPMKQEKYVPFLTDIVLSMVIAGRDTTACLLSWLFFELCRNPDIQEKLAEEVFTMLGGGDDGRGIANPTFDMVTSKNMPYLTGCIYEALRLHPPVPSDPKECQEDTILPDGTPVFKGEIVMFSPWVMGRDGTRYPCPLRFDPTRWIPFKQPSPYEFPVFQAGPRICLGRDMALLEAKVVTSLLVRRFRFRLVPGEEEKITYSATATMSIINGENSRELRVIPEAR